jgi:CheY-like chemotaxis protein
MPPKRILIVDDSLELGRVLRSALEVLNAGLSIRLVPSAEEGLLELNSRPVDLLIADVRLPGRMTGLDLVQRVQAARTAGMKVIIITGWAESNIEEQARQLKADAFLRKPLNMGEFLDIASNLLNLTAQAEAPAEPAPPPPPRVSTSTLRRTGMLRATGALAVEAGQPEGPPDGVAAIISRLRSELGAQAVVLFNPRGRIEAQTGELPYPNFEQRWGATVLNLVGSSEQVLRSLNGPAATLAFRGELVDFVVAPVGGYALVLVLRADRSALRLPLAVEELLLSQLELAGALSSLGVATSLTPEQTEQLYPPAVPQPVIAAVQTVTETPVTPVEEAVRQEDVAELEALLAARPGLTGQDVDAFWESPKPATPDSNQPDVITYDQARRLGLAPEEGTVGPV